MGIGFCTSALSGTAQEGIFTLYMLRRVGTTSDLLAPYDKTQGDPERYLYLVVNRKIPPKHVINTAT
jgi:hypothetical protein